MILPVFLNFVAMATAYLSKISKYKISYSSKKVVPLIYISTAYISSVKIVEIMS